MKNTWIEILKEVPQRAETDADWTLHFQKVVYHYVNGESDKGFRFIWRRPDGSLQAARGQARIPGEEDLLSLYDQAKKEGLFD